MLPFKYSFYFIASLFLFSCGEAKVDNSNSVLTSSIFDVMYEIDTPEFTLSGDLSHLMDKNTVGENNKEKYFSANLTIDIKDSNPIELPLRIAKRGVTRKTLCELPPIKFKFSEDTLVQKGYAKWNTYKFVTHCIPNGDDLVLAEYLAYKLYNHLSDKSFRVKMVKMKYEDHSGAISDYTDGNTYYGFIIEEDEELAYRLDAELYEGDIKSIDRKQYAQMVVFQYMIGNTDWNLAKGHNIKWIQQKGISSPTPLPYDFDFCGFVNAPHAAPHPQIPIKSVRERFLQWRGKSKDELNEICKKMIADKKNILDVVRNAPHLTEEKKSEMMDYLNSFFKEIETKGI